MEITWGTELITYFNTDFWGLDRTSPQFSWVGAFDRDPRFYFDRMLDSARDLGLRGVELAPNPGGWRRAQRGYGDASGFKRALDDRGLRLAASYTHAAEIMWPSLDDPAHEPAADAEISAHAEFVKACGADIITMGTMPRAQFGASRGEPAVAEAFRGRVDPKVREKVCAQLNRLGSVVARHGVRLAIHTDSYSICSRPDDVKALMEGTDPKTVLLCPDSGHMTIDSGDPVKVLRENISRVPIMHWKDAIAPLSPDQLVSDGSERHQRILQNFRIPGRPDGVVDWKSWLKVLKDANWSGWAMLEEDMAPDPNEALRAGRDFFRNLGH
jgi:inosose dehydratase